MRVSMCVGGGGGGVGGFFHVFCKNLSPSVILNPRSLPPCCSLGHIYPNPVADTHDQIHYTLTQLPSQRWGGGHSTYTVYSCWGTGSAGGYRVIECEKRKRGLMLTKCKEPIWPDTGAAPDHHPPPDPSTPASPSVSLSSWC